MKRQKSTDGRSSGGPAGGGDSKESKEELWARLQAIHQSDAEAVRTERENLEQEKKVMNKLQKDASDIVSINAGGQVVLQAHRETLCLATGSSFSSLFTGRWEDSCARDEHGRVFLDHDPEMIQWIVNYLRIKKIEDPSNPVGPPPIPKEKKKAFMCLLNYFGLKTFFYPSVWMTFLSSELQVVQPEGSAVTTQLNEGALRVRYDFNDHYFAAITPAFSGPGPHVWKCTISSLPSEGWMYLGVISNLQATKHSYRDSTSNGWATSEQRYVAGRNLPEPGWSTFQQGEVLCFRLQERTLTMFSMLKNRSFRINNVSSEPYIHFNFHKQGTEVVLESMSESEIAEIQW